MTNIVNLTPHQLNFYSADGETLLRSIPSSGVARVKSFRKQVGEVEGIPVNTTVFDSMIEGLPEPQKDAIYIVSAIAAQVISTKRDRDDVYIVDDSVRDGNGKIIGVKALAKV